MARPSGRTSRSYAALIVGLVATLAVLLAWSLGAFRRAELAALDIRFRHVSRHRPTGEVLHVDIDDGSLERIGRWPWPRERLARTIQALYDCGARCVVLDVVFPEPQGVRFVDETADVYTGLSGETLGEPAPRPVYDDAILAATVAVTPTLVPVFFSDAPAEEITPPRVQAMRTYLAGHPQASLEQAAEAIGLSPQAGQRELADAYRRARALQVIERLALPDSAAGDLNVPTGQLVPPLVTLAQATRATGFVSFWPDLDGVVRHMPMIARSPAGDYPQFALATFAQTRATPETPPVIQADEGGLVVTAGSTRRLMPVDERGRLLINWPSETTYRRWLREQHIPAGAVAEIVHLQDVISRNTALKRLTQLELARDRHPALLELFAQADRIAHARRARQRQRYLAMLYDPAAVPPEDTQLAQAEAAVERQIDETFDVFRRDEIEGFYLAGVPDDPEARRQAQAMQAKLDRIDRIEKDTAGKREFIATQLARLRPRVAGKVCFLGSTASGAADFVPTPLGVRMPGVYVHGWIYETLASGRFIAPAGAWLNAAVILACGLLLTWVASRATVPFTLLASLALAVGYVGLNARVVFEWLGVWLDAVAPLAAMASALLAVTACRQLTEERAKRQIRAMFSHALSPTLVDRLIDDPDIARLGGHKRNLTCMFSDLARFTTLAEQLGPEQTVRLLNRYFDGVTEAVQDRGGGYLNKFLGDGVFCFFGAPVMQDDHPRRAIRAALDCRHQVRELQSRFGTSISADVSLGIRVGIATGEAMVGNCGSTTRMDYTAIGDSVNLAARLEAANKYFGTEILITDVTRQAILGELFLLRYLGRVVVTGQSVAVGLWQVAGEAPGQASDREAVEAFARGMQAFAARQFESAIACWQEVEAIWPDDGPSRVYTEIARHCISTDVCDAKGYVTHAGKGVDRILYPWHSGENIGGDTL